MGLLSTEVEIGITGKTARYYEQLGYDIPKYFDRHGDLRVKNGTKITVKVNDLSYGSSAKVDVECDCCKNKYPMTYSNYNKINHHDGKIYCKKCAILLFNTGENSSCYKKDKTAEEREGKRLYPEYTQFVKKVLARDNYTCQCCGRDNAYMEVHHLDGYDWCKDKRVDDTNGITLCENCHSNFHAIYGSGNNTKEQFEEWIGSPLLEIDKFNGEISSARKIYCYEENKIYNSATEFIRTYKLKAVSTVYFVCNQLHHCKTIKGMHLFWYDEYINMTTDQIESRVSNKPIRRNKKLVICLETNMIYESINVASKEMKIHDHSISNCCNHRQNYVINQDGKKIKVMFYDEYLNQLEESA